MPARIALYSILFAFLIGACAPSEVNPHPTLVAITVLPESNQGPDPQFKSTDGGEPRSSGYWLIWNTCAKGNQSEAARNNGGREAGWVLMDDLFTDPGILIGALVMESCEQGVNILQARDLQGNEMKNDAAYSLAAQLLVAQLNLAVGSTYCPASDQAVNEAQSLLLELNFDGTGAYLGPPLANLQIEKAQSLARQLANYNAGALCT